MSERTLRVLSLGGGVQSSTLALRLGCLEDLGAMPDVAIFADTGDEPPSTHRMVDWLATVVPYPVHKVRAPLDILTGLRNSRDAMGHPTGSVVPMFTVNDDGSHGQTGRFCTDKWKTRQIKRKARELLGVAKGYPMPKNVTVEMVIGISLDEIGRMRVPEEKWITNVYPLIDARITRHECELWWQANAPADAPPLARSACVMCPYHSDAEWMHLQDTEPQRIDLAVQAEADFNAEQTRRGYGHVSYYLHARRIPLAEALAAVREENSNNPSLFDTECGGLCGI